ncbi:FAD-dependent oxidoreductase [bacterium]|nr:FAD-dependent oxidoreductase [bacterium]
MAVNKMIELTINGQPVEARPGQTIYEVVTEQGLDRIPTLCHAQNLEPYASCFVCVVELEGKPNLVPSCATKVAPGMVVNTRNERIIESRRTALELLMSNHYADCLAPCVLGCPAHVDIQGYIALAARGQTAEAADLIRQTNPLPAVCGRVCVRKCEEACRRKLVDDSVAINDLKRYITDSEGSYDSWPERAPDSGKRVGIVGAGPAGLTAAYFLGLRGHECTIYEMMPEPGGMLRYGIPSYRLPRDILTKEIDYICTRAGVRIECDKKLGRDIELAELREEYDAVYLAMGAIGSNPMGVQGEEDTEGVLKGLEFLMDMAQEAKPINGTVIVIGGGNTAMDAARTSWRLGADKVIVVYRRTRAQMPADPMEVEALAEEGIEIIELAAPQELVTNQSGRLTGIKCIRMKLGEPDDSGRRRPVPIEGSEFVQNCDWCISAIGQSPILDGIDGTDEENMPATTRWNTLVADGLTYATRVPKVFAGGDVETGPSVAIDCIAAGQKASRSIHAFLLAGDNGEVDLTAEGHMAVFNAHTAPHCDFEKAIVMRKDLLGEVTESDIGDRAKTIRQKLPEIEVEERASSFTEVATGFTWDEAHEEWARCLSCGCLKVDDCRLREYCSEYNVDLTKYAGTVRKYRVDDEHPYIIIDSNKCVLCTKCIRTCEQVLGESALGLVNRGFGAAIEPALGKPLADTPCVSCGNCEAACPTGALTIKYPFPGRAVVPAREETTTCGFCSLACTVNVKLTGSGRYWMVPPKEPGKHLCRFGRFGAELFIDQDRVTAPLKREMGAFKRTSFEDAFQDIAVDLRQAVDRYGPEAVAVFVSPELTNEQYFLAQHIARDGLGTNNISSLSMLFTEGTPGTLTPAFGFTASTAERKVLEQADLILINNCDLKIEQLILAMKVIEALNRGAKVIAAAGVHGDLIELGTLNLEPLRGTSTLMWRGVVSELVKNGFDRAKIEEMPGSEEYLADVDAVKMEDVVSQTGEDLDHLQYCAKLLSEANHVVVIHSPDRTEDKAPGDLPELGNLMTLLHSQGKKTDLLLPRAACNTAGLETCGAAVEFRPGRQPVPAELRQITPIRDTLIKRLVNGEIKAALIIGEDPMRDNRVRRYLQNLRFLAVVSDTMSETANAADIVLPGTNYLEEQGTRINFEGRLHEFKQVMTPPAGRDGWRVLCGLAGAFRLIGVCDSMDSLKDKLKKAVRAGYGEYTPFYWNTGERRDWRGPKAFQRVKLTSASPHPQAKYQTVIQRYKYDAEVIGIQNFRMTQ